MLSKRTELQCPTMATSARRALVAVDNANKGM